MQVRAREHSNVLKRMVAALCATMTWIRASARASRSYVDVFLPGLIHETPDAETPDSVQNPDDHQAWSTLTVLAGGGIPGAWRARLLVNVLAPASRLRPESVPQTPLSLDRKGAYMAN